MNEFPFLSVVIPTHRRAELLRKCLRALRPGVQTLDAERYEVIVSDDSDDGATRTMVERDFPEVVYTRSTGMGPGPNRNHGSTQARGNWLVFIDDDCVPVPGHLKSIENAATQGQVRVVEGAIRCPEKRDHPLWLCPDNGEGGCFWTANLAIERELFREMHGFDDDLAFNAEDIEMGSRIRHAGIAWVFEEDARVDHPAQKLTLGQYVKRLLTMRALLLYAYKTGEGTPLEESDLRAVVALVRSYFTRLAYNLWHAVTGRNTCQPRTDLVSCVVRLVGAPVLLPYLCIWELRYRRMLRDRETSRRVDAPLAATARPHEK
jgi:glycosyltransferase involved in cell wall biosynthesis